MHLPSPTKKVLFIVGPTASGKTALAVDLARHFNTCVISADSRQVYKKMEIGTAQPSPEEMKGVTHHFLNFLEVQENYTAGRFEEEAMDLINLLHQQTDTIIVAGGSGLYLHALIYGIDSIPTDKRIRGELTRRFEENGIESLVNELKNIDPEIALEIDTQNPQRVIRALESCLASGEKYSTLRKKTKKQRPFTPIWVGIDLPRETLYSRINDRVDEMMAKGWLKEAEALIPFRSYNALQTVGYRELFDYLDGKCTLEEAIDKIKQHTRNFAKRQMTWFKKNEAVNWLQAPSATNVLNIVEKST